MACEIGTDLKAGDYQIFAMLKNYLATVCGTWMVAMAAAFHCYGFLNLSV
jgi:hypothetical protein